MTINNAANLTHAEATVRSTALSLSAYYIHLDFSQAADHDQDTFPVATTVEFSTTTSATFLDFLGAEVHEVSLDGTAIDYQFTNGRIELSELPTDTDLRLYITGTARFSRTGQGLHRMLDKADGATYLYSHLEPSDARRIFPCFDQPDLKAVFHVRITAPHDWAVLSNQPEIKRQSDSDQDSNTVTFAPTPKLSTYLTSFAAGPYVSQRRIWQAPDGALTVDLGAWARASMAQYMDDEILELTARGMDYFHRAFAFPYPWGKYDSIFVPEYNLGAMENPGLVTFTESYLFRSRATRSQRAGRANTILHEMSHMWFGDLVTPRWWDDLWLKESFADYMGADASVEATDYSEAWVNFAGQRKNWAYLQDQLPTTHPIATEVPDVDAARQNFDGITYAKGAAALKQLVHYVGRDNFFAGVRDYFHKHAFAAANFNDLLDALAPHTDRDLAKWSDKWLRSWGPDTLTPEIIESEGTIAELAIVVSAADTTRPHRISVSLFDDNLARSAEYDVDLRPGPAGEEVRTTVPAAAGQSLPALVLLNDGDYTYAKVRFDAASLITLRERLSEISGPGSELTRAVIWTALWNMTRDNQWPVKDYVPTVIDHAPAESNPSLLATALNNASYAVRAFTHPEHRDAIRQDYADKLWSLLTAAEPGSDTQLVIARQAIGASAASPAHSGTQRLRSILDGELPGLELDPDIRWSLLQALAAKGEATPAELDAELQRDNTLTGATAYLGARYSYPQADTKREAFDEVRVPGKYSNAEVDALLAAFNAPRSEELTAPFAQEFFGLIDEIWRNHPIEIANRLIRGLYPQVETSLAATDAYLTDKTPTALRRVLLECQDQLHRQLQVQKGNQRSAH